jgi:cell division protein FtsB
VIDWSQLKTAQAKAAEQAKAAAVAQERETLKAEINAGLPANSMPAIIARIDVIERLLGLKPLQAEG